MDSNELKKLKLLGKGFQLVQMYYAAHRFHDCETYRETMHSVEKLADASFRSFAEKSKDQQTEILARLDELCKKINEALGKESPLVVALALLTAIRVHEQLVNRISN